MGEEEYWIRLGKGDVKRRGKEVRIVGRAIMVEKGLEGGKEVEGEGMDVEMIEGRTVVGLDEETIMESVKKRGKCIVVDEGVKGGG